MKKQLIVLSAAAMIAAAALPALALENEFHGMYRLRSNLTNFQTAGLGAIGGSTYPNLLSSDSTRDYTLFEQRARLQYIAKASDDLKLVTHFEIDSTWGDSAYNNSRGVGGAAGADTVNFETKNVYLDFNVPSTKVNMKVGIQGFTDAYKGVFLVAEDVGGAVATGKFDALTATAGFIRTYDKGTTTALGKQNIDIYLLDGKFAVNKDLSVGGSYYYINNDMVESRDGLHMIGLNTAVKAGMLDLDAFVLYQVGNEIYNPNASGGISLNSSGLRRDVSAMAAQVAAKANLGAAGTVRVAGLYASGNDNSNPNDSGAFQNIFETSATGPTAGIVGGATSAGAYYTSSMMLMMRNAVNMDSDNSIVASLNNKNQGLLAAFVGYDAKINDKLTVSANVGMAWVDKKNQQSLSGNQGNDLGTELNAQVNYAIYPNLIASVQLATLMLGDHFDNQGNVAKTEDPANPYLAGLMLNYSF